MKTKSLFLIMVLLIGLHSYSSADIRVYNVGEVLPISLLQDIVRIEFANSSIQLFAADGTLLYENRTDVISSIKMSEDETAVPLLVDKQSWWSFDDNQAIFHIKKAPTTMAYIVDITGNICILSRNNDIDISSLRTGVYLLFVENQVVKFLKE